MLRHQNEKEYKKMNKETEFNVDLPITRDIGLDYIISLLIASIMTGASFFGLLYRTLLYPKELFQTFVPYDVINIIIGLPILLGSMWFARRGKLIGLLFWPGALLYILYTYIIYLICIPFNVMFLPYLVLVTLSFYALICILLSINSETVRQRLADFVPPRTIGGILVGIAILLIVRTTFLIITALINHLAIDVVTLSTWITDFLWSPALIVGGIMLWQCKALGYVAGAALLLQFVALTIGIIPCLVIQALILDDPIDVVSLLVIVIFAALSILLLRFFVRGSTSDGKGFGT
jgi:hypothetical protein